eukprot:Opistho-2@6387
MRASRVVRGFELARALCGTMDEVRVWSYARSAAQIQSTMNLVIPTADLSLPGYAGLEGYWSFDESSGFSSTGRTHDNNAFLGGGVTDEAPSFVPSSFPLAGTYIAATGKESADLVVSI